MTPKVRGVRFGLFFLVLVRLPAALPGPCELWPCVRAHVKALSLDGGSLKL